MKIKLTTYWDSVRSSFWFVPALVVGTDRTHEQDIEFPINQLVQVAIQALSPAINDPITAIIAIEHLRAGLCSIAERSAPSAVIPDAEGAPRLLVKREDASHNVEAAFSLIRQYGRGNLEVTISLLDAIEQISRRTGDEAFRRALLYQATLIGHGARSALPEEADRKQVGERFERVLAALEAVPPSFERSSRSEILAMPSPLLIRDQLVFVRTT